MKTKEEKGKRGRPKGNKNKIGWQAVLAALPQGESIMINGDHVRVSGWLKADYNKYTVQLVQVIEGDRIKKWARITKLIGSKP